MCDLFCKNILKISPFHCKSYSFVTVTTLLINNTLSSVTIRAKSDFCGLSPTFYNHVPLSLKLFLHTRLARASPSLTSLESVRSSWASWSTSAHVLNASRSFHLYMANSSCSTHLLLLQPCLETKHLRELYFLLNLARNGHIQNLLGVNGRDYDTQALFPKPATFKRHKRLKATYSVNKWESSMCILHSSAEAKSDSRVPRTFYPLFVQHRVCCSKASVCTWTHKITEKWKGAGLFVTLLHILKN